MSELKKIIFTILLFIFTVISGCIIADCGFSYVNDKTPLVLKLVGMDIK